MFLTSGFCRALDKFILCWPVRWVAREKLTLTIDRLNMLFFNHQIICHFDWKSNSAFHEDVLKQLTLNPQHRCKIPTFLSTFSITSEVGHKTRRANMFISKKTNKYCTILPTEYRISGKGQEEAVYTCIQRLIEFPSL